MKYNKLIRDKIPEIVAAKGGSAKIHLATDEEYWEKLKEKLQEEVNEFIQDSNTEELADITEVLLAIYRYKKISAAEVEEKRKIKFDERGGFSKRIILEES